MFCIEEGLGGYLSAAVEHCNDDMGRPLRERFTAEDFSPEARALRQFMLRCRAAGVETPLLEPHPWEAGWDIWLSRHLAGGGFRVPPLPQPLGARLYVTAARSGVNRSASPRTRGGPGR